MIRDVGYLRAYGITCPPVGGLPLTVRLPWERYAAPGVDGRPVVFPEGLLEVVRSWTTHVVGHPTIVLNVEAEPMHGRPPGPPANPFLKPARFTAYWPREVHPVYQHPNQ